MKNIHVLPTEKEPVKGDLEKEMFELEQELDIPSHLRWHNSKPKQETLEEAAENHINKFKYTKHIGYDGFIEGAKWQKERMYSEEDIETAFYSDKKDWISFEEFIDTFKNK